MPDLSNDICKFPNWNGESTETRVKAIQGKLFLSDIIGEPLTIEDVAQALLQYGPTGDGWDKAMRILLSSPEYNTDLNKKPPMKSYVQLIRDAERVYVESMKEVLEAMGCNVDIGSIASVSKAYSYVIVHIKDYSVMYRLIGENVFVFFVKYDAGGNETITVENHIYAGPPDVMKDWFLMQHTAAAKKFSSVEKPITVRKIVPLT